MLSQPIRAAWIEINFLLKTFIFQHLSQPIRAAWIEIVRDLHGNLDDSLSQPIRAAWIEIISEMSVATCTLVAAHSGCVD